MNQAEKKQQEANHEYYLKNFYILSVSSPTFWTTDITTSISRRMGVDKNNEES
jgi:hypothetical protein